MSSGQTPGWGVQPITPEPRNTQTSFLPGDPNYRDPNNGQPETVVPSTPVATTPPVVTSIPQSQSQSVLVATAASQDIPLIVEMLRDFAKNSGCEKYTSDSEKIKLLGTYLWVRQLTPTLSFETFLELYAPLADFDGDNLKHPDDAIKNLLPRSAKAAEAAGAEQWTAKQVVEFVSLYVDIVREAENQSQPIPQTLVQFLQNKTLQQKYRAGEFNDIVTTKAVPKSKGRSTSKKQSVNTTPPTNIGQRCLYNGPANRQYRGQVTNIWTDDQSGNKYANFKADSGEEFQGVGISLLTIITDPPPNPPATPEGEPLPQTGVGTLRLKKVDYHQATTALQLQAPMGNVEIGQLILGFTYQFQDGKTASVHVINGETRPYVDAFLSSDGNPDRINDTVIAEVQPRNNIEGTYTFVTENDGTYTLEVSGRE